MKKHIASLWLLALLLLAGCEREEPTLTATPTLTPSPAPSSQAEPVSALELELGEGLRSFWVELTRPGEPGELVVSIYKNQGDAQPFQSFTEWALDCQQTELTAEDVNFDGYTDFHFPVSTGTNGGECSAYYIWENGRFVPDPYGLNELENAWFNVERREVGTRSRNIQKEERTTWYQYEDGALVLVGEEYDPGEGAPLEAYCTRRITPDPDHTFWVELVQDGERGSEGGLPVSIQVYDQEKTEVLQRFEDACMVYDMGYVSLWTEDVDFDGCPDLCYSSWAGAHSFGTTCLVWDQEQEKFLQDPYGLRELCLPSFDPENRVIKTWNYSGGDNETEYYRYYRNDKGEWELTCVRRLLTRGDASTFTSTLIVEDYDYGELIEVYRAENVPDGVVTWPSTREFQRWKDPDYSGGWALRLDVGDGEHSFWIEAEPGDWLNEFEKEVTLSIYRQELDEEPVQVIKTSTVAFRLLKLESVDANFDGAMDFRFLCQVGATNGFYSFWLWDGETETFVKDHSDLGSLSYPRFNEEEELIYSHMHGSATSSTDFIYAWREGELVCLRSVYHAVSLDEASVDVVVWDEGQRIIEKTYPSGSDWSRWLDLDYQGEG